MFNSYSVTTNIELAKFTYGTCSHSAFNADYNEDTINQVVNELCTCDIPIFNVDRNVRRQPCGVARKNASQITNGGIAWGPL